MTFLTTELRGGNLLGFQDEGCVDYTANARLRGAPLSQVLLACRLAGGEYVFTAEGCYRVEEDGFARTTGEAYAGLLQIKFVRKYDDNCVLVLTSKALWLYDMRCDRLEQKFGLPETASEFVTGDHGGGHTVLGV